MDRFALGLLARDRKEGEVRVCARMFSFKAGWDNMPIALVLGVCRLVPLSPSGFCGNSRA